MPRSQTNHLPCTQTRKLQLSRTRTEITPTVPIQTCLSQFYPQGDQRCEIRLTSPHNCSVCRLFCFCPGMLGSFQLIRALHGCLQSSILAHDICFSDSSFALRFIWRLWRLVFRGPASVGEKLPCRHRGRVWLLRGCFFGPPGAF